MIYQRRTRERWVNIPTPLKMHFSSCTRLLQLHAQQHFVSQDFSICLQPTVVQVSALCLRRTDIRGTLSLVHCCRLAYCDGSTRKQKSLCVHASGKVYMSGKRQKSWRKECPCMETRKRGQNPEQLQTMPAVVASKFADWSSDTLRWKDCPKEVWQETEEMLRWLGKDALID